MRAAFLFLVAVVLLGAGISNATIAGVFSDPVSGIRAQDETLYASSAVGLATHGEWSTPKVLGRYLLVKPPLLIWLAALSMKMLGISLLALRLPVLLAGAAATVLLLLWPQKAECRWAAAIIGILLIANPLWHTFSRICYTDMLLAASITAALYTISLDPPLARTRSVLLFAACIWVGVMAKNVAGLLPLAIVLVFYALSRPRPPVRGLLKACAFAAVLLAPWHLYQLLSHPRWFWADYVQIQLLQFGFNPPAQPTPEGPVMFYLKRLILTDPVLCLLALAAVPAFVRAVRRREAGAALLLAWLAVCGGALLAFRYHNLPYLLSSIPPLCLISVYYMPRVAANRPAVVIAALAVVFCAKALWAGPFWRISYGAGAPIASVPSLRWYANLRRKSELVSVDSDDDFYGTVLPISKIRYCYIDREGVVRRYAPHYAYLGITVDTAQFDSLEQWAPRFRERLRSWGLDSMEPVGTNIVAGSTADVLAMIQSHPHSDFYLPAHMRSAVAALPTANHRVVALSRARFFLLALEPEGYHTSRASWSFSQNW